MTKNVCKYFQVEWRGVSPDPTNWWTSCFKSLSTAFEENRKVAKISNVLLVNQFEVYDFRKLPLRSYCVCTTRQESAMERYIPLFMSEDGAGGVDGNKPNH